MTSSSAVHDLAADDDELASVTALAELPQMGPARLFALLIQVRPSAAWQLLAEGGPFPDEFLAACGSRHRVLTKQWRAIVNTSQPVATLERYRRAGISVWWSGGPLGQLLANDPAPPVVLFLQGTTSVLNRPRVALIGTRNCSLAGRATARRFGAELAEAGVSVVSGLALGIDGAAHTGALEVLTGAPPLAIVGSGLDRRYPRRNAELWQRVSESGLLISEAPLGAAPEPWRFPARNRLIAALSDFVVVVESHDQGGSLLTVNEALERNVPVGAVPGSIAVSASKGTNRLLMDGASVICGTDDILSALSLTIPRPVRPAQPVLERGDEVILAAIERDALNTDELLLFTALTPARLALGLQRLQNQRLIEREGALWSRVREDRRAP